MSLPDYVEKRRQDYKPRNKISILQKRREEFLARQREDRRNLVDHIRKLTSKAEEDDDDDDTEAQDQSQAAQPQQPHDSQEPSKEIDDAMPIPDLPPLQPPNFDQDSMNEGEDLKHEIDEENLESNEGEMEEDEKVGDRVERRKKSRAEGRRQKREFFAQQLLMPEWMIDIPEDFPHNWYAVPRPEGLRCLVIASGGQTVSRKRNGSVLHRFASALPCGSHRTLQGKGSACVLDCIYQKTTRTYWVLDMMCWKGYSLYSSSTEFRNFWVFSKLAETTVSELSDYNKFCFRAVPFLPIDGPAFQSVYAGATALQTWGFVQDGILFYNKEAHYEMGPCPLVLVWKDQNCSAYVVDTDNNRVSTPRQMICLVVDRSGRFVQTLDGFKLGTIPENFLTQIKARPGSVLKFSISSVDEGSNPLVHDLLFHAVCPSVRLLPDSWSRILFQNNARLNKLLTFEEIFASSSTHKIEMN